MTIQKLAAQLMQQYGKIMNVGGVLLRLEGLEIKTDGQGRGSINCVFGALERRDFAQIEEGIVVIEAPRPVVPGEVIALFQSQRPSQETVQFLDNIQREACGLPKPSFDQRCTKCGGEGREWVNGFAKGPICDRCNGTGKRPL